ncbi:MAG: hypothetical protein CMH03_00220 [Marinovum sp.]|nr:hypothetical protein [Marinovum sp.]|tara:strand:+ start:4398 stop:4739 length:342 start_codon:yes stop_codon:yes gene_type:complete
MDKLKNNLASIAALIAAIVAIGGGFVKYGELTTKLTALENQKGVNIAPLQEQVKQLQIDLTSLTTKVDGMNVDVDLSDMDKNKTGIAVNNKEIEVLKLQIQELKLKSSNPLAN